MSELLRMVTGRVYRAEAGEGGEAAGGGSAGQSGDQASPAPAGADAGGGSLLKSLGAPELEAQAAAGSAGDGAAAPEADKAAVALQAAEKDTRRPRDVPAKYWDAEKGEIKVQAWAKSTAELETRMRTIGLPPKDAAEYKFDMPQALKDAGLPDMDQALFSQFKGKALEHGLTQKQFEFVMGEYYAKVQSLAEQSAAFSTARAQQELLAYYKTPEALRSNVRAAYQVFSAFADDQDMAALDTIGNIPAVIRILAKIAPEMAEDSGLPNQHILAEESLEHLMRGKLGDADSPYWNPQHPQHKATRAKVERHHQAVAAANRRKAA